MYPPDFSVRGISQACVLAWVATSFSRGSSQPRDRTCISCVACIADGLFTADLLGNRNPHLMYCCTLKGTKEVAWYVQKNTGALPFAPAFLKGILTVACRVGVENHRFHRPWVCHSISVSISQSFLPSLVKWGWSSLSCLPPQKIMRTKWEGTHSCLENCKELHKLKMCLCFWQVEDAPHLRRCACPSLSARPSHALSLHTVVCFAFLPFILCLLFSLLLEFMT